MASSEPSKAEIATAAGMPTHDTVYSKPGDQGIHNPILETVSETVSSNKPDKDGSSEDDTGYLKGYRLVCMVIGLALAVFCMGLVSCLIACSQVCNAHSPNHESNQCMSQLTRIVPSSLQRFPELRPTLIRSTT